MIACSRRSLKHSQTTEPDNEDHPPKNETAEPQLSSTISPSATYHRPQLQMILSILLLCKVSAPVAVGSNWQNRAINTLLL